MKQTPIISSERQFELRNQAKLEMDRIAGIDISLVDKFKNEFLKCEAAYKELLKVYIVDLKLKSDVLKMNLGQVVLVLKYAGYDFSEELIKHLFGPCNEIGNRSNKKLRDALNHKIQKDAIDELNMRRDELFNYFAEFQTLISDSSNSKD